MIKTFPYLAIRKQAPPSVPRSGVVHLRYDDENDELELVKSDGTSTAVGGGTLTSNGDANPDLPLKTDANGSLAVTNLTSAETFTAIGTFQMYAEGSIVPTRFAPISPTATRTQTLVDATGHLPVLRAYNDSTAANAAVSVGDAWWDLTLKKARVRLS